MIELPLESVYQTVDTKAHLEQSAAIKVAIVRKKDKRIGISPEAIPLCEVGKHQHALRTMIYGLCSYFIPHCLEDIESPAPKLTGMLPAYMISSNAIAETHQRSS